ncbi:hypothetical protein NDN01_24910 [Sphingomonas sp. QA11]|uniref:terminase small subunit-like protein n=1 Tax=Sphingomonas sp. QA11 TaxID=2950605 RepID=UPI00234B5426|nr:hypothetical protein [Sphingomonas sp. QA11]WCM27184.1 hypothetical protein NDN01_24910 [Sphingomonas sp. QA11]
MTRRSASMEEKLLTGIAGGRTLRELCRALQVGRSTVYDWMKDEDFAHRMAWARAIGFDAIAEEMLEIADDSRNDWVMRADAEEKDPPVRNPDSIARSKLRIDTRLRVLAHWDPRRYGAAGSAAAGGIAGMTARDGGGEGGSQTAAEPVAIAARLASLLTTISAREPDLIGHGGDIDDPD